MTGAKQNGVSLPPPGMGPRVDGACPAGAGAPGVNLAPCGPGLAEVAAIIPGAPAGQVNLMAQMVENRIVPRLIAAHRGGRAGTGASARAPAAKAADIVAFTDLVLANDHAAAMARIHVLAERGASLESICADLLTPAARHLDAMWADDQCSFIDVTAGLGTLQTLLHCAALCCEPMLRRPRAGWRVLLATLPTEQHSLGLHMVAESFRAAGWDVTLEIAVANADLVGLVGGSAFAVIGFSLGRHSHAGELALTIRAIRKVSANPHIGVMVGGPAFLARPDLVRGVGADFTASCAGEAVARADALRAMLAAADNSMT